MDKRSNLSVAMWFLTLALTTVLKGNIFEFGPQLWSQEIGTAMGTKLAPSYANLFMAKEIDPKIIELAKLILPS